MQNELGSQIGRFKLLALLGTGGFATVYRAEDTQLGRQVALKILHPHLANDDAFLRRFNAEARAAARLRHPHIVTIHEVGQTPDGRPYLVMTLLDGQLLSQIIALRAPLPQDEAAAIVSQLASALDYLHAQGLVHRDLKPANVMVDDRGSVTLMDFGIARALEEQARLTQTGQMVGTPAYMAPEQISGDPVRPPADIYALGVVAYELFAGRPPFSGSPTAIIRSQLDSPPPPVVSINPRVPPLAARAIEQALAKDPAARPPTASAFAAMLTGESMTEAMPRPLAAAVPPPLGRTEVFAAPVPVAVNSYRWVVVASVLVGLIILGLLALIVSRRSGGSSSPPATTVALKSTPLPSLSAVVVTLSPTPPAETRTATPATVATAAGAPTAGPTPTGRATAAATATPTQPPASAPPQPSLPPVATIIVPPPPTPVQPTATQSPETRVATALHALPPANGSASFIDQSRNTEIGEAAQTPVPAGGAGGLILAEAIEEAIRERRLDPSQQLTIQQNDVGGGTGDLRTQVGKTVTLRDLLQRVLVNSDNTGANMLLRALGGFDPANQEARRLGLNQTSLSRPFGDAAQAAQGSDNVTSAHDLALLLTEITESRGVDRSISDDMIGMLRLREQQFPSVMSRGAPRGSVIVAIGGVLPDARTEVGLLQIDPSRRAVLAVALRSTPQAQAENLIAQAAGQVVQAFAP